jgi:hypothetical protein
MTAPIENILNRLEGVQKAGKAFKARCPAHPDRTPSLSLKEADDGRVLLHCFSGCEIDAVVAALGLQMSDLFPPSSRSGNRSPRLPGVSLRDLQTATEFEKQLLYIVKADQVAGKTISQLDWERAKLALQRIALARRVL